MIGPRDSISKITKFQRTEKTEGWNDGMAQFQKCS